MRKSIGTIRSGFILSDLLLGADRLTTEDRRSYQTFFLEVVRQRGFPLHTASLWNALEFGWDLDEDGYLAHGLRIVRAETGPPIPIGSMVEVKAGNRILWAEVVYKEGRDTGVDAALGFAEPGCSGTHVKLARSRTTMPVREALILDFNAFGDDLNESDTTFERAARKGWLTTDRHLEVEAIYGPTDGDELLLFARRVIDAYGDTLFGEALRDGGKGVSRDERWQLLLSSLQAVEEFAVSAPGLRTFGQYHFDATAYERRIHSVGGLFDGDGLTAVARSLVKPTGRKSYTAVGPLIREYLARGGIEPDEQDLLDGPGYARLVIETNATVADLVGETGMFDGAYVRLDDEFQRGGIWRAIQMSDATPAEAIWHPLLALGLGYAETQPSAIGLVAPVDDVDEPLQTGRTDKGWRVAMRLCDLERRELPIPVDAMAMLTPDATDVLIDFDDGLGKPVPRTVRPLDRVRRVVSRTPFGASLFPGVYLGCSVGFGGRTISVRATVLPVPKAMGERLLRLEFHEPTFRRDALHERLEVRSVRKARTLVDQIAAVFRERGRPLADGGRALSVTEIVAAILGPSFDLLSTKPITLALEGGDYKQGHGFYIWRPTVSERTSPRERQRIVALRRSPLGQHLASRLMPRQVPMHLSRKNPHPVKVATYAQARVANHALRLPEKLPAGRTWVRPWVLGG